MKDIIINIELIVLLISGLFCGPLPGADSSNSDASCPPALPFLTPFHRYFCFVILFIWTVISTYKTNIHVNYVRCFFNFSCDEQLNK